jgi:hypothetical protein
MYKYKEILLFFLILLLHQIDETRNPIFSFTGDSYYVSGVVMLNRITFMLLNFIRRSDQLLAIFINCFS